MQKTDSTDVENAEEEQFKEEETERIRWSRTGNENGPVIVFFVGIHGNEPAGIYAVDEVAGKLSAEEPEIHGSVYAITGNIEAIKLGVRFLDTDLNRLWERFNTSRDFSIRDKNRGVDKKPAEYLESIEIKKAVNQIVEKHRNTASELVFVDLHTTSSQSCAFILLNDTLANRHLTKGFPVPQILGIEENIKGTLLSYINNLGFKAIGFEAGAHQADESVRRCEAFIWLVLHRLGVHKISIEDCTEYEETLRTKNVTPDTYYEIIYHKPVQDPLEFKMISGFENFDTIEKNIPLAYEHGKLIRAPESGRIFMPLYQKEGTDGFFIIREVSAFWLTLSAYLRKNFFHKLLPYLPGVTKVGDQSFEVDLNVARVLVKDIFHLLGYRVIQKDENTLICYRR